MKNAYASYVATIAVWRVFLLSAIHTSIVLAFLSVGVKKSPLV